MLHKDYVENLKLYHSHLHEHSLAKMRKYPMFSVVGEAKVSDQEDSSPNSSPYFYSSHRIERQRKTSSDWEADIELEAPMSIFGLRYLKVDDDDDDYDRTVVERNFGLRY